MCMSKPTQTAILRNQTDWFQVPTHSKATEDNKVRKRIAVCATSTTRLRELTCHMGSNSITCHQMSSG